MKYCDRRNCSRKGQLLPYSEFHRNRSRPDGYCSGCKVCLLEYIHRPHVAAKRAAYNARYRRTPQGKDVNKRGTLKYRQKNPDSARAQQSVKKAIEHHKLPHPTTLACAYCGQPADQYHHHMGYAREHWRDVVPICAKCHGATRRINSTTLSTASPKG